MQAFRTSLLFLRPGRTLGTSAALAVTLILGGCSHAHNADTVAKVNGKPILMKDVESAYQDNLGDSQQKPSVEQADIVRLNIVRQLIDKEILEQRASKLNLTATDEEVDEKLNEIKSLSTEDQFNQKLAQQHMTLDDLKHEIRSAKTSEKLFNKEINSKINVTDSDISSYYNAHKGDFNLPEPNYHLAQIIVTNTPLANNQQGSQGGVGNLQNSKASTDADAKKKIEMLHNRLVSGEDFGALAANFSERPDNASNGGDMGFITDSQLKGDMAVYNAIQKLKPGQITEVLPLMNPQTGKPLGYAIYRLLDKDAAGQRELNDPRVQQAIRQQLRDTRAQLLKNAYIEVLRDQAKVENYYAEDIFKHGPQ